MGPRRLQGGAVCIECRRTVHGNLFEVLRRGQNELLKMGCEYCGRVKDLYLAPLVQAREYHGVVSGLPNPSSA